MYPIVGHTRAMNIPCLWVRIAKRNCTNSHRDWYISVGLLAGELLRVHVQHPVSVRQIHTPPKRWNENDISPRFYFIRYFHDKTDFIQTTCGWYNILIRCHHRLSWHSRELQSRFKEKIYLINETHRRLTLAEVFYHVFIARSNDQSTKRKPRRDNTFE